MILLLLSQYNFPYRLIPVEFTPNRDNCRVKINNSNFFRYINTSKFSVIQFQKWKSVERLQHLGLPFFQWPIIFIDLPQQMEHFPNLFCLSHTSIWWRTYRKWEANFSNWVSYLQVQSRIPIRLVTATIWLLCTTVRSKVKWCYLLRESWDQEIFFLFQNPAVAKFNQIRLATASVHSLYLLFVVFCHGFLVLFFFLEQLR